jgi:pimeloyl-ACP methyl ester carboxylesterase
VAWLTAITRPDRVRTLTAISTPHPLVPPTMRQHEMAWYQLFFQFYGVAEATIQHDDWAWLRMMTRGDGDLSQAIEDLSRPGALTASLNWYRANVAPRMPGPVPTPPPVAAPTLGIWSTGDHYLDGERMKASAEFIQGPWRYEEIPGASHWVPLDAPDRLNDLLLDWLP